MGDSRIQEAMTEQGRMETGRANFNSFWQQVADRVDPSAGNFTTVQTPGTQQIERQFDSTATIALGRATAAFESFCTPRTQKWHNLVPSDDALAKDQSVKIYMESLRDLLFKVRYSPRANFANQNSEFIRSDLNYGNGVLYLDDNPGVSLRYKTIALAESFFAEDHNGQIDRFHRKFKLTARQLATKFPNLSAKLLEVSKKQPDRDFEVLHRVCTNWDRDPRRKDYHGAAVLGYYIIPAEEEVVDMAGFGSMPYLVGRYRVNAREVYGRGPVMDILASIKVVNEMEKTNLRVGQRTAAPPLLAYRDGLSSQFNIRSDYINYGGLNSQGREMVKPLQTNEQLPVSLEMQDSLRTTIKDALFVEIFNILKDNPQMTATQVLQLVQERGVLMAPPVGNLQQTYGQMISREIELLSAVGGGKWLESQIGAMPQALRDAGGNYEIEFDAPINKAQKAEEGIAILQTLQDATAFSQVDPSVMKVFDLKKSVRKLAEIRGYPSDLLVSDEDIEAQAEEEASQAQLAQLLEAAPVVAGSAKDLAQASAVAGTSPQAPPSLGV